MTLDEAIKHAEEVAEENSKSYEEWLACKNRGNVGWSKSDIEAVDKSIEQCKKCAEEHRQLAEWLKDYKRLKEQEPCDDAISRQTAINIVKDMRGLARADVLSDAVKQLKDLPSVTPQPNKWIPITSRSMTEEEKELYKIHPDYQDNCRIFNCKLPDDGQEVLISVYGVVEIDTFVRDANDGCYFESRNIDEVDAWMPLPQPYKQEVAE